jgi:acyl dehydratase
MATWGVFEESAIAMLNIRDWTFRGPIFIGDTLRVEMSFTGKRLTSRGDSGIIERAFRVINQSDVAIQTGHSDMMIALRPAAVASA